MAGAKLKQGLDYYPSSTRADSKFKITRALHGYEGYVILDYLLKDIHGEKGYYMKWNERLAKIFAVEHGFTLERVMAVVTDSFIEGIFDEEKFSSYQILTSIDIQNVWINVAKERKEIIHVEEYLLIDISPYFKPQPNEQNESQYDQENCPSKAATKNTVDKSHRISPDINSINPAINSNYPADNNTSKGRKAKEAEQANQANEFKQGRKSEALNFGHEAEFHSPVEKLELIEEKKMEIRGENFIILRTKNTTETYEEDLGSGNQEKGNSGGKISLNSQKKADESGQNPAFYFAGKQEKIFIQIPEDERNNKDQSENINRNPPEKSQAGFKVKSPKKQPHPARSEIVRLWEEKFGQPYENSWPGNSSINRIIRHLEKLIKRAKEGEIIEENELSLQVINLWKIILSNWDKLDKFYKNLIRFESIADYLAEIINQLKDYGTTAKRQPQTHTSGQKPSFNRFRK